MGSITETISEFQRLKNLGEELYRASALEKSKQVLEQARITLEQLYQAELAQVTTTLESACAKLAQKNLALGDSYLEEGNLELAKEHFTLVLDVAMSGKDKDEARIRLGQIEQREAPSETLEKLNAKVKEQPDSPEPLYEFATTLAMEGYMSEAVRNLERLAQIVPDDPDVYYRLGSAYADLDRYDEAKAAYEKALSLGFEDRAEIYFRTGAVEFRHSADHVGAKKFYKKGLEANPEHVDSLKGLAHLNELEENFQEAVDLLKQAVKIEPEDVETRLSIATLYQRMEKFEDALATCEAALKVDEAQDRKGEIEDQMAEIRNQIEEMREASGNRA